VEGGDVLLTNSNEGMRGKGKKLGHHVNKKKACGAEEGGALVY